MNNQGVYRLGTDAALALAIKYLPSPVSLSDARLFASGNIRLWKGWQGLEGADRTRIALFLRLRPESVAEDSFFLKEAAESLDQGHRFRWREKASDRVVESIVEAVPGKPIDQLIDELLTTLKARRRDRIPSEVVGGTASAVYLRDRQQHFTIPRSHLPTEHPAWPVCPQAADHPMFRLDRHRLIEMADRLDKAGRGANHRRNVIESFLAETVVAAKHEPFGEGTWVEAGSTQLVVAPTGTGKSIFATVLALEAAERAINVAVVVPDIKEVLKQCHEFELAATALRLPLTITPVNSPKGSLEKAGEFLQHPVSHDPEGTWTLDRLGYHCRLSAYAEEKRVVPGDEPCFRLRQTESKAERYVSCPFARTCPKFDTYIESTRASILVVNHAAFLTGRIPMPVRQEDEDSLMSVMELVLRRCQVILIDEVDQFQHRAIEHSVGGLQISSRVRLSPLHELLNAYERKRAADELPLEIPNEPIRRQMYLLNWLAGLLADLLNRGTVRWPKRDLMLWSGAYDGWLAGRLFADLPNACDRLEALFGEARVDDDETAERLRKVVLGWIAHSLEEDRNTDDLRAELMSVLAQWPRALTRQPARRDEASARVADTIILRVLLSRVEQALSRLRPQLATLEQFSLDEAREVRDQLLGYAPWRPAPAGALGRRVLGFSFQRYGEDPGALHAQALAGDPHAFVASIGDETALAFAGTRRVVMGLSATARFAGSTQCDVIAPIALLQPDIDNCVTIMDATVQDATNGEPIRISGISGMEERHERAARLGFLIWEAYLRNHLKALRADKKTRARARVLLVTGSYPEARVVAMALSRAIGSTSEADARIRYLARRRASGDGIQVLLARELDSFGDSGADILIAPLSVVSRGHNILQPGTSVSAIASIFVLVRPVPPVDDPARVLAHVSYDAVRHARPSDRPGEAIMAVRRRAEQQLRYLQSNSRPFKYMPPDLRHYILCDVLAGLDQLAGRARRGGTDVRMYLVDGAFQDDLVGWKQLIAQAFDRWHADGALPEMMLLHRSFLSALHRFSGLEDERWQIS